MSSAGWFALGVIVGPILWFGAMFLFALLMDWKGL